MRQCAGWALAAGEAARGRLALLLALSALCISPLAQAAIGPTDESIQLVISPRICTLTGKDKGCQTSVRAQWKSPRDESLCLIIVTRPDVKRCWEHYSQGTYTIELNFDKDLVFQLRDVSLDRVLASEVLRVIREAILYRHKRRQPWNIFD